MEVDNKIEDEWELINKLNSLGTRDREDLLSQFQSIVGTQMSPGCSAFYLEMGNWNLQTALGAYYDLTATENLPALEVVTESFHVGKDSVRTGEPFVKSWTFKNTGAEPWPSCLKLKFIEGHIFSHGVQCPVPSIGPGEVVEIRVPMIAPEEVGLYHNKWRPITISGSYFGTTLYVSVNVDSKEITHLTERFNSAMSQVKQPHEHLVANGHISQPISAPSRTQVTTATPFCSPTGYGIFGGGTPTHCISTLPTINESQHQNFVRTEMNFQSPDNNPDDILNRLTLNQDEDDMS